MLPEYEATFSMPHNGPSKMPIDENTAAAAALEAPVIGGNHGRGGTSASDNLSEDAESDEGDEFGNDQWLTQLNIDETGVVTLRQEHGRSSPSSEETWDGNVLTQDGKHGSAYLQQDPQSDGSSLEDESDSKPSGMMTSHESNDTLKGRWVARGDRKYEEGQLHAKDQSLSAKGKNQRWIVPQNSFSERLLDFGAFKGQSYGDVAGREQGYCEQLLAVKPRNSNVEAFQNYLNTVVHHTNQETFHKVIDDFMDDCDGVHVKVHRCDYYEECQCCGCDPDIDIVADINDLSCIAHSRQIHFLEQERSKRNNIASRSPVACPVSRRESGSGHSATKRAFISPEKPVANAVVRFREEKRVRIECATACVQGDSKKTHRCVHATGQKDGSFRRCRGGFRFRSCGVIREIT